MPVIHPTVIRIEFHLPFSQQLLGIVRFFCRFILFSLFSLIVSSSNFVPLVIVSSPGSFVQCIEQHRPQEDHWEENLLHILRGSPHCENISNYAGISYAHSVVSLRALVRGLVRRLLEIPVGYSPHLCCLHARLPFEELRWVRVMQLPAVNVLGTLP